ncbi:zinc-ribbon and DUF3426 domain-containing protein [Uliginosibacterium sediminicola]|uniref:Zinc-ribbon and DUF3426 domain-containing protein n=1 Tax=Uliginosibacterium sediminicola TaxID=2024550 RepID=A0ABU9YX01_9RHOO
MLITRCPHCLTSFRIRPEQLNLRGGRVRCGHCHVAFSALSYLDEMREESPAGKARSHSPEPIPASEPSTPPAAAPSEAPAEMPVASAAAAPADAPTAPDEASPGERREPELKAGEIEEFSLQFDFGPDFHDEQKLAQKLRLLTDEAPTPNADPAAPRIEPTAEPNSSADAAAVSAPHGAARSAADDDEQAPESRAELAESISINALPDSEAMPELHSIFLDERLPLALDPAQQLELKRARRRLILANCLLLVGALLSTSFALRTQLASWQPGLRPLLERACQSLGCSVPYPKDLVVLGGIELTPAPEQREAYNFTFTVRNEAAYPVAWPQLDVTLTDRYERTLTRRVLEPAEWLPVELRQSKAFEAQGELTTHLTLGSNVQALGYRLGVFYR